MTNLSYQIDERNGTSCRSRPPMLHPQLGSSSITPLRKPSPDSLIYLIVYQRFQPEPPHRRGYPVHLDPKYEEWTWNH